jgi:hypothetical protein
MLNTVKGWIFMEVIRRNTKYVINSAAQKSKGVSSVLLTSALMMLLTLPIIWVYARMNSNFFDATATVWLILLLCVSIAGGGAIGFRVITQSWRQTVLASVLAGAGIMLISRLEFFPFYPGIWNVGTVDPETMYFNLETFLMGTLIICSPIFLLPLFDPVIRKTTFTPNAWKVVLTAFLIMVPFLCFDLVGISYGNENVGRTGLFLAIETVVPVILLVGVIGVLTDPYNYQRGGNLFGSVGIVLEVLMFIVWALLRYGGYW